MPVPKTDTPEARLLIRDRVLDKIRTTILDGTLEPGERLHDDDLINWLGVSRTPLREALSSRANEGLVEMAPNRYTRVALPHPARSSTRSGPSASSSAAWSASPSPS
jgi:DNA-binding GntR family transcriptional regulator